MNQRLVRDFTDVIFKAMDVKIKNILSKVEIRVLKDIEEIRIRVDKPLMLCKTYDDFLVGEDGSLVKSLDKAYIVSQKDVYNCLQLLSQYSIYSIEEELSKGFITLRGGHRVGITGKTVMDKGTIKTMKYVNSLNYRVMREVKGCSENVVNIVRKGSRTIYHTLIAGPPKCGKTTILRDLIRALSYGDKSHPGLKIGVVDERSEIAGCYNGIPQNDLGIRTDVLDCCPKALGIINLIRSMSPEVIATDEVGSDQDLIAIREALNAGVKVVTTVHGGSILELLNRPNISEMIKGRLFEKIILLDNSNGVGTVSDVVNVDELLRVDEKNVS